MFAISLNRSATSRRLVGDQSATGSLSLLSQMANRTGCCLSCLKAPIRNQSPTSRRSVADKSAIGHRWVAAKFESATGRRSIADQSATSWQSFGDLCNLFEIEFSRGQSFVHVQKTARD